MYVHVIVAEMKTGRILGKGDVVHHRNGNRLDNSPENIKVMTRGEHVKTHAKKRSMVKLKCTFCGKQFERRKGNDPESKGYTNAFCSRSCNGKFNGFTGPEAQPDEQPPPKR